ncbi:DUF4340 domain-containing protein [bacterium]|nr:DUF4340 domain-containing protein [bacterium]
MKKTGLLAVVLVALGIIAYFSVKGSNTSFSSDLPKDFFAADTTKITSIELKSIKNGEIAISKEGEFWKLTKPVVYQADQSKVNAIINEIPKILINNPEQSNNPEKFEKYQVSDSTGTFVKFLAGNEVLAEFIVGKSASSGVFLRQPNKNAVILAESFNSYLFTQPSEQFRDRTVCKLKAEEITKYFVKSLKGELTIEKADSLWVVTGSEAKEKTTQADESLIETWGARFANLFASKFHDAQSDFTNPTLSVKLTTPQGEKTFLAVEDKDTNFYQVKYSDSEQIFLIAKGVLDSYNKSYDELKKQEQPKKK